MTNSTTVYIVEDSDVTRSVIREMLTLDETISVVGESGDGEVAVKEVLALKPTVAIVDIGLPSLDGLQVLRLVKAQLPELKAIMLTSRDNDNAMFEAFSAGAAAYLVKTDFNADKLIKAISDVRTGLAWCDPGIAHQFLKAAATQDAAKLASLSTEEKRILQLVADQSDPREMQSHAAHDPTALDKIESEGPGNSWDSFLQRLERFKE